MQFSRFGECFKVARITGPKHNLLGIEFDATGNKTDVEVRILPAIGKEASVLSADDVQQQVLKGVDEANQQFSTRHRVKCIEFVANDSPPAETYKFLAYSIVEQLAKHPKI